MGEHMEEELGHALKPWRLHDLWRTMVTRSSGSASR
jgi:hypothetical protein